MSSHHIIRENQEPALIIDDFDVISEDLLGQLLEWSPTVITHDLGLLQSMNLGIKVDYVILSNSNQDHSIKIRNLLTEGIVLVETEKNFYDASVELLRNLKNPHANILSRQFPLEQMLSIKKNSELNLVLIQNSFRYIVCKSTFTKWKPKGSLVHLPNENLNKFVVENLQEIENGVFETQEDGFFKVSVENEELFLIGENVE